MNTDHGTMPVTPTITGNPFSQQRDFLAGTLWCDVSHWTVMSVSGPDRLTWLHSLISQDVLGLKPGETREGLILDPQGHIEHAFLLTDDGDTTWLLEEPGRGDALHAWLSSMVFRMQVTITNQTGRFLVVASSQAMSLPYGEAVVGWSDPWPRIQQGSTGYAADPHPGEGFSVHYRLFEPEHRAAFAKHAKADPSVLSALQIAAGRPALADLDEKSLPHEYDWLRTAVHLNKGCYRGQETVAKVHNLGHPPRRLTLLHLDGSGSLMPQPGDPLMHGEKEVGRVTRAAWHHELGPIALALLKRSLDTSATLTITTEEGHVAANQEVLVPSDAGATRNIPRIPRLGATS